MKRNTSNNANNNNKKKNVEFHPPSGLALTGILWSFRINDWFESTTDESQLLPISLPWREWCYRLTSAAGSLLDHRLVAQMTWSRFAQLLRAEHVTLGLEVTLKHSKRMLQLLPWSFRIIKKGSIINRCFFINIDQLVARTFWAINLVKTWHYKWEVCSKWRKKRLKFEMRSQISNLDSSLGHIIVMKHL